MRPRILVVDDEEAIGRVMRRLLFGYDVTDLTSGRDALDRVQQGERFDAVICDLHMPEMDGIEFAARLALIAPELASNHFLFLTGDPDAPAKLSGRNFLLMPFETHALRSRVEQLVRRGAGEEAAREVPRFSMRPTVKPPPEGGSKDD